MCPDRFGTVQRRWKVGTDGIQELFYTDIRCCGTAQHRGKGITHGPNPQAVNDFFLGQLARLQILLGQGVVGFSHRLDQLLPQPCGLAGILSRDGTLGKCPRSVLGIKTGLHPDQVDHPLEISLNTDRHLDCHTPGAQGFFHIVDCAQETGPLTIQLVDKGDARDLELVGPAPDLLGLGLDTGDGRKDHYRTVQGPHAGAGIGDEVAVTGGVHDVDGMAVPLAVVEGRGNRYLALDLFRLEVHGGRAVIHPPQAVDHAGIKEDRFGQRGLAGPAMCHNSKVTNLARFKLSHLFSSLS